MRLCPNVCIDVNIECPKCNHEFEEPIQADEYVHGQYSFSYHEECPECGFDFNTIMEFDDYEEEVTTCQ